MSDIEKPGELNAGNSDKNSTDVFALYRTIVDRAHTEIESVRSVYKWLAATLAILIVGGAYFNFQSASDFRNEARTDIKDIASVVQRRVDNELQSEAIQEIIRGSVRSYIEGNAERLISSQIEDRVRPRIDEADERLKEVDETLRKIKARSRITELADKAIGMADRKALDELDRINDEYEEGTPLQTIASAERVRVRLLWANISRSSDDLPLKNDDGTIAASKDFTTKQLAKMLLEDDRWGVRRQSARYLSDRREEEALKALIESMKNENDLEVLREVQAAYERITRIRSDGILLYAKIIEEWYDNREEILDKLKKQ